MWLRGRRFQRKHANGGRGGRLGTVARPGFQQWFAAAPSTDRRSNRRVEGWRRGTRNGRGEREQRRRRELAQETAHPSQCVASVTGDNDASGGASVTHAPIYAYMGRALVQRWAPDPCALRTDAWSTGMAPACAVSAAPETASSSVWRPTCLDLLRFWPRRRGVEEGRSGSGKAPPAFETRACLGFFLFPSLDAPVVPAGPSLLPRPCSSACNNPGAERYQREPACLTQAKPSPGAETGLFHPPSFPLPLPLLSRISSPFLNPPAYHRLPRPSPTPWLPSNVTHQKAKPSTGLNYIIAACRPLIISDLKPYNHTTFPRQQGERERERRPQHRHLSNEPRHFCVCKRPVFHQLVSHQPQHTTSSLVRCCFSSDININKKTGPSHPSPTSAPRLLAVVSES